MKRKNKSYLRKKKMKKRRASWRYDVETKRLTWVYADGHKKSVRLLYDEVTE